MTNKKRVYGEKIITAPMRLVWPALFTPEKRASDGKGSFKVTLLAKKDDPRAMESLKAIKAECVRVAEKAYGTAKGIKMPFRDGEEKSQYDGYAGCYYFTASGTSRPHVVLTTRGGDGKLVEAEPHDIYPGCYVRVAITPAEYPAIVGQRGVNLFLGNVQKVADGDRLGGGGTGSAEDDFEAEEGTEEVFTADEDDDIPF